MSTRLGLCATLLLSSLLFTAPLSAQEPTITPRSCPTAAACTAYIVCQPAFEKTKVSPTSAYCYGKASDLSIPETPTCALPARYQWAPEYTAPALKGKKGACITRDPQGVVSHDDAMIQCRPEAPFNANKRACIPKPSPPYYAQPDLATFANVSGAIRPYSDQTKQDATRALACPPLYNLRKLNAGHHCARVMRDDSHTPTCAQPYRWDADFSSKATGGKKGMCVLRAPDGSSIKPSLDAVQCRDNYTFKPMSRKCVLAQSVLFAFPSLVKP